VVIRGTPIAAPLPLIPSTARPLEAAFDNTEVRYELGEPGTGAYRLRDTTRYPGRNSELAEIYIRF
jgi:hypothetical protein